MCKDKERLPYEAGEAVRNVRRRLEDGDKGRLLFVCLGNICRSPAAEEIFRSKAEERGCGAMFEIDSAGLYGGHAGDQPDRRMRVHAYQRGYLLTHRRRQVRNGDFSGFDMILAMDRSNYDRLRAMAPTVEDERKVVMMADFAVGHPRFDHVPDPYYEGAEGFELVLDLLEDACENLLGALTEG